MEVQPINIQLNTSTDDESENETSLTEPPRVSCQETYTVPGYHPPPDSQPDITLDVGSQDKLREQDGARPHYVEFIPSGYHMPLTQELDAAMANITEQVVPDDSGVPDQAMVPVMEAPMYQTQGVQPGNIVYMDPTYTMMYGGAYPVYPGQYYQSTDGLVVENPVESESMASVSTEPTFVPAFTIPTEETDPGPSPTPEGDSEDVDPDEFCEEAMVYPTIFVSTAGMLTVLLRNDIAVEMTLDKALRVVNNRHRTVAATNNLGDASCIHHPAAKIYQDHNTTEAELCWNRRTKLTPERALFACKHSCFQLSESGMQCAQPEFAELMNDMSITILFSSSGYGPHLSATYEEMVTNATYRYFREGGISVWINNIKITQNTVGDVTVSSGKKIIRASPVFGTMYVETPFIEMTVERNWNVKINSGKYRVNASFAGLIVTDGNRECGFDQYQHVFIQPKATRKQPIIRNGVFIPSNNSPWRQGQHDRRDRRDNEYRNDSRRQFEMNRGSRGRGQSNYYNERHMMSRYHYNRYQNYHNMNNHNNSSKNNNNNNHNQNNRNDNHQLSRDAGGPRTGQGHGQGGRPVRKDRPRNPAPLHNTASYTGSSNSLDEDSTIIGE